MIRVLVNKESNYPVSSPELKRRLKSFLIKKGIVSDYTVSVAVVGEKKILELSRKYLGDKNIHNVLSFTESEVGREFTYPPGKGLYLGEIVICFPRVLAEAKAEGKLISQKAYELIEHGARHLLGEHHDL